MANLPLVTDAGLTPVLKILTDYPRDDLAHDEVHQALVGACVEKGLVPRDIDVGAIPGKDTIAAGFKTAQLALNSRLGFGHVIHANCAPRTNIVSRESKGESLVLGMLPNGVSVLVVNAGYALAPFRPFVESGALKLYATVVPDAGSQFRSRDYFPAAVADFAIYLRQKTEELGKKKIADILDKGEAHTLVADSSLATSELPVSSLPFFAPTRVLYVDNFGNIKLNISHEELLACQPLGEEIVLCIGDKVHEATIRTAGFSQSEGMLALTRGSSGWVGADGREFRFAEIMLRGDSAADSFSPVRPGQPVLGISRTDLQKTMQQIRSWANQVDLYTLSEARLLRFLAERGLIKKGFDARGLKTALENETLQSVLLDGAG